MIPIRDTAPVDQFRSTSIPSGRRTMNDIRVPRRRWAVLAPLVGGLALVAAACVPPPPPPPPPGPCTPVVLGQGHVDAPGIAFEDGEWDLHIHDEDNDTEYEPECATLKAEDEAETLVPANPAFAFLGSVGDPIWILPQVEDPDLLYLGYGTEEIGNGTFVGDQIDWSLVDVDGPGAFIVYSVDGFGTPTVLFNSNDPLPQTLTIPTGTHTHVNWAFTAEGEYTISYSAAGELEGGGGPTDSGPVEYTFQIGS
jgi:surface-anchored protein